MYPSFVVAVVESRLIIWPIVFPVKVAGADPDPPFKSYVTVRAIGLQVALNR